MGPLSRMRIVVDSSTTSMLSDRSSSPRCRLAGVGDNEHGLEARDGAGDRSVRRLGER
jgi:hypothetical protein